MTYIPKHNIYNNTFQIFLLDKALKRTAEYFVMYSKTEMGTSQMTEIVPVWEYKGEGAEKMYFYSRIKGGQLKPQTHNHMCTSKKSKLGR